MADTNKKRVPISFEDDATRKEEGKESYFSPSLEISSCVSCSCSYFISWSSTLRHTMLLCTAIHATTVRRAPPSFKKLRSSRLVFLSRHDQEGGRVKAVSLPRHWLSLEGDPAFKNGSHTFVNTNIAVIPAPCFNGLTTGVVSHFDMKYTVFLIQNSKT